MRAEAEEAEGPGARRARMSGLVVGIDVGGTADNVTVLREDGVFLIDRLGECPSRGGGGPAVAVDAMAEAFANGLAAVAADSSAVSAVGLGTPGPASRTGVLSSRGATNFAEPAWWGFDVRAALQERLGLPVTYSNDANAAALYAHHRLYGDSSAERSSVSAIVGTGLGGGLVVDGAIVAGRAGQAGELGHVRIALDGVLAEGQPEPMCNCGRIADAESVASLTGITRNLLPYWLGRFPDHPLAAAPIADAAKRLRSFAEAGDPLARRVFGQQAAAIGRLFMVVADVIDPDAYFVGGGVIEAEPEFRDWFVAHVREHMQVRPEQSTQVELVADGDMAGARGAALAAWQAVQAAA